MGKQVLTYMLDSDTAEFLEYVRTSGDVLMVRGQRFASSKLPWETPSDFPSILDNSEPEHLYLWNRAVAGEFRVKEVIPYDPSHPAFFTIDVAHSTVVEIRRSRLLSNCLTEGRLWMEPRVQALDLALVPKSPAFLKWFDSLFSWIRRECLAFANSSGGRVYVGRAAADWVEAGGRLQGVP